MSSEEKVSKNSFYYIVAGLAPFLTSFIMLPIYTRLLGPEDYGVLALINIFGMLVAQFMSMQLGAAMPRFYFDYRDKRLDTLLSTLLISVVIVSILIMSLLFITGDSLTHLMFPNAKVSFFPCFALSLMSFLFGQISSLIQYLLVAQQRGKLVLTRTLLGQVIGISGGVFFVVVMKWGIIGALLASLIEAFVIAMINLLLVRKWIALKWDKALASSAFSYSWPIIPHALGNYLFMYSDRVILEKFVPVAAIGLYSISDKFATILKTIVNATNDAILPTFLSIGTKNAKEATEFHADLFTKWAVMLSLCFLALSLFCENIIQWLTPPSFHEAALLVPILLMAYIFRGFYNFSAAPIFLNKKTKLVPVITVSAGAVNIGMNMLLVPAWGVYAAAWMTVLSFFIAFSLALLFARRELKVPFQWGKVVMIFLISINAFLLVEFFKTDDLLMQLLLKASVLAFVAVVLVGCNLGGIRDDLFRMYNDFQHRVAGPSKD